MGERGVGPSAIYRGVHPTALTNGRLGGPWRSSPATSDVTPGWADTYVRSTGEQAPTKLRWYCAWGRFLNRGICRLPGCPGIPQLRQTKKNLDTDNVLRLKYG